ncbi:MAG: hypothetical protein QXI16_03740 [Sulfolobaceae archaeon]
MNYKEYTKKKNAMLGEYVKDHVVTLEVIKLGLDDNADLYADVFIDLYDELGEYYYIRLLLSDTTYNMFRKQDVHTVRILYNELFGRFFL